MAWFVHHSGLLNVIYGSVVICLVLTHGVVCPSQWFTECDLWVSGDMFSFDTWRGLSITVVY